MRPIHATYLSTTVLFVCLFTDSAIWAFGRKVTPHWHCGRRAKEEGNRLRYTTRKWLITIRLRLRRRRLVTSSKTPWRYGEE